MENGSPYLPKHYFRHLFRRVVLSTSLLDPLQEVRLSFLFLIEKTVYHLAGFSPKLRDNLDTVVPGPFPAIINQELFEAAQKQLQVNRAKAMRNTKREYLLRGHIKCRQCGHVYVGGITRSGRADGSYRRLYRCLGKWKDRSPFGLCQNKSWGADKLEALVWQQIEGVLDNPELIITEIEKQRQDANQLGVLEAELQQVERQLNKLGVIRRYAKKRLV